MKAQTSTKQFRLHNKDYFEAYTSTLDARMQRSMVLGSSVRKGHHATLFYDLQDDKFTLMVQDNATKEVTLLDCQTREQWGRNVMVFGHATRSGGYIASGHATLDKAALTVKLKTGLSFQCAVDANAPFLKPFVFEQRDIDRSKKPTHAATSHRQVNGRGQGFLRTKPQHSTLTANATMPPQDTHIGDFEDDFSEEDLARLRGDLPLH